MAQTAPRPSGSAQTLGPYSLVTELHKSEIGALWAGLEGAKGDAQRRVVAVRVVAAPGGTLEGDDRRAIAEAAAAEKQLEQGLVAICREVIDGDPELGLVSSYIEAETLEMLLRLAGSRLKPLGSPVALRIATEVLDALASIYAAGVAELPPARFALPSNVLLGINGRVWLSQPGPWSVAMAREPWKSRPALVGYSAPELLDGAAATESADVFAVGVMLWEVLANKRLYLGTGYEAVKRKLLGDPAPRLEGCDVAVADVVQRALQADPAARFASCADMADALHDTEEPIASAADLSAVVEALAASAIKRRQRAVQRAGGAEPTRRRSRRSFRPPSMPPPAVTESPGTAAPKPADAESRSPVAEEPAAAPKATPKAPPPKAAPPKAPPKAAGKAPPPKAPPKVAGKAPPPKVAGKAPPAKGGEHEDSLAPSSGSTKFDIPVDEDSYDPKLEADSSNAWNQVIADLSQPGADGPVEGEELSSSDDAPPGADVTRKLDPADATRKLKPTPSPAATPKASAKEAVAASTSVPIPASAGAKAGAVVGAGAAGPGVAAAGVATDAPADEADARMEMAAQSGAGNKRIWWMVAGAVVVVAAVAFAMRSPDESAAPAPPSTAELPQVPTSQPSAGAADDAAAARPEASADTASDPAGTDDSGDTSTDAAEGSGSAAAKSPPKPKATAPRATGGSWRPPPRPAPKTAEPEKPTTDFIPGDI